MNIVWKVNTLSADIASLRYRAILPSYLLKSEGFDSILVSNASGIDLRNIDVLVFVKAFTVNDYVLAQKAHSMSIPIILDLCDNIFIEDYGTKSKNPRSQPSYFFNQMAMLANQVVVTTQPLADVVSKHTNHPNIRIIPDGIESSLPDDLYVKIVAESIKSQMPTYGSKFRYFWSRVRDFSCTLKALSFKSKIVYVIRRLYRAVHWKTHKNKVQKFIYQTRQKLSMLGILKKKIEEKPLYDGSKKRLLWFGNHGAPYANFGISDILLVSDSLKKIAKSVEIELIVLSNNVEKFNQLIKPFPFKTTYFEWSRNMQSKLLEMVDVVIIPNSNDDFSICKSANRAVTSLIKKVPVVATSTPTLSMLSECVYQDGFESGLMAYLVEKKVPNWSNILEIIEREFGNSKISNEWSDVLKTATSNNISISPTVVVIVSLIQDVDLAIPIVRELQRREILTHIYCNSALLPKSPRAIELFKENNIIVNFYDEVLLSSGFAYPPSVKSVIAISESTLGPHRFSHHLIKIANRFNLETFTLQHGFENAGLTYNHPNQQIKKITFAASNILIWGGLDTLHPEIPNQTKLKCIPVGCPKKKVTTSVDLNAIFSDSRPIVGVFENLHWERYSTAYRATFVDVIQKTARAFPDYLFVIKPHHAGYWTIKNAQFETNYPENVIILDPKNSEWEKYTAPSIIGSCQAVITTPSTVAIDAALQGVPVAVFGYELQLKNYKPLPILNTFEETYNFIRTIDNGKGQDINSRFLKEKTVPGDAFKNISDQLLNAIKSETKYD